MLKKLLFSRNNFFANLFSTGSKYKIRISKFFEFCELASRTSRPKFTNSESSIKKTIKLRGICAKTCGKVGDKISKNENKCMNEDPCQGGEKNLVAVVDKNNGIQLEEREIPTPCADEVLIAMHCVGFCSTKLSSFSKEKLPSPSVLARIGTGIVTELGDDVQHLCKGDRIVIDTNPYCGKCEFCKKCKPHLCSSIRSCGLKPYDGLLCCYGTHPANSCYKLPNHMTMEDGLLIAELATGINVCDCSKMSIGTPVLVIGAGSIGLVSIIAAKAMGATTCLMCEFADRLEISKFYKTPTVQIPPNAIPEDMAKCIRNELGCNPEITVDTVGSENSMKLAIAATESGGNIVLASVTDKPIKIALHEIAHRDITIRSALKHANKFPKALALAGAGTLDLKPLVSHHFNFNDVSKAVEMLMENKEMANEIVVNIRPRDSK